MEKKNSLTSRERIRLAINHKEPDRIPVEVGGGVSNFHEKIYVELGKHFGIEYWKQWTSNWGAFKLDERLLQCLNVDVRHVWFGGGGTTSWTPVKIFSDGTFTDLWGIRYKVIDGIYSNIVENPLRPAKTVKDIKDYFSKLPDPKAVAEAATKNLEEEAEYLFKNTTYGIKGEPMWSHFELCQWIRGMDEFFIDMIQNEEMAYSLFNSLFEYECKMFEIYFKKVGKFLDIVWVSDDFGAQYGLLVRKDMMVNQVKPWQKKRIDFIRERAPQAKIFLHSCGSVYDFIPDLIEIGLDGLNPLQPFAKNMEPERLKSEFGKRLVFMGGLDHQFILSRPVNEVKEFVVRLVKAYAPGGGYIFSTTHVTPASARVDSIAAAFEYIQEIGKY